jgi:hypothetical protein
MSHPPSRRNEDERPTNRTHRDDQNFKDRERPYRMQPYPSRGRGRGRVRGRERGRERDTTTERDRNNYENERRPPRWKEQRPVSQSRGTRGRTNARKDYKSNRDTTFDYIVPRNGPYFEHDDRDQSVNLADVLLHSRSRGSQRSARSRASSSGPDADKRWTHDLFELTLKETTDTNSAPSAAIQSESKEPTSPSVSVPETNAQPQEQTSSVADSDNKVEETIDLSMSAVYE